MGSTTHALIIRSLRVYLRLKQAHKCWGFEVHMVVKFGAIMDFLKVLLLQGRCAKVREHKGLLDRE